MSGYSLKILNSSWKVNDAGDIFLRLSKLVRKKKELRMSLSIRLFMEMSCASFITQLKIRSNTPE